MPVANVAEATWLKVFRDTYGPKGRQSNQVTELQLNEQQPVSDKEHQDFETHLNRNSIFTSSLKSMLEIMSVGTSVKPEPSPAASS